MLHEVFNSLKQAHGEDYFTSRLSASSADVDNDVAQNLNPKFELREYQKEALGRFDFYFNGYQRRAHPAQLLFHMATGSGKTLIMAAAMLQLYQQGYRNFIFFTRLGNIIGKTKDNFLNELSSKYLFAGKIKFGEREARVREVNNFSAASPDDINIIFTTTALLHTRLNNPKENALTYEDFEDQKTVLIADEAHNLNALTKLRRGKGGQQSLFGRNGENLDLKGLNKGEKEEVASWEGTVERIFHANQNNILLEFTATIGWEGNSIIKEKYEDKLIFDYALKQFRLDGFSKEVNVLRSDSALITRVLQAIVVSQYRRKIAEKNRIRLKPVVLFKAKTIKESWEFKKEFDKFLACLKEKNLLRLKKARGTILDEAFAYFDAHGISLDSLARELQVEFAPERCLLFDSKNIDEERQVLVNSLEDENNQIRALFAVDMLNEGWDVLNLFDIVRLYDTRQSGGSGLAPTTIREAQLIGRGARYYPFSGEGREKYQRKYDDNVTHELRILEELHYHSSHDPKYIAEIRSALTKIGIIPENYVEVSVRVKDEFKKTEFWKEGKVFANERVENALEDILSLDAARIGRFYDYNLQTGETREEILLGNILTLQTQTAIIRKKYRLLDFGENVVRSAMDILEFYRFGAMRKFFPHIESREEFMASKKYLGDVMVEVIGRKAEVENFPQDQKLGIAVFVLERIANEARINTADFVGTKLFKPHALKDVFKDKIIKIAKDDERAKGAAELNLVAKDWYAQNELYGTSEEKDFVDFFEGAMEGLRKKYDEIALLRNERALAVFDFEQGRRFEPDFILMLKEKGKSTITLHQVFVEPKGNQFKDSAGGFENSQEGWKQKFLLELEKKAEINLKIANKQFRLLGLSFYNKDMQEVFEEAFKQNL